MGGLCSEVCGAGSWLLLARSGALRWDGEIGAQLARSGSGRLDTGWQQQTSRERGTKSKAGSRWGQRYQSWVCTVRGHLEVTRRYPYWGPGRSRCTLDELDEQGSHQGLQHTNARVQVGGVEWYRPDTSIAEETSRSLRLGCAQYSVDLKSRVPAAASGPLLKNCCRIAMDRRVEPLLLLS